MTQKPAEEWWVCQWLKYYQVLINTKEIHNPELMYQQQKQTKNSESQLKPASVLLKLMQIAFFFNQKKKLHGWYSEFSAEVGCIF